MTGERDFGEALVGWSWKDYFIWEGDKMRQEGSSVCAVVSTSWGAKDP